MQPNDEEEDILPSISKWPFYLGDAFLVGLAIAIAILDGWQLGGVQVFACVLAVALGAGLLVFPFVIEYQMFAREEKEDRAGEIRSFKKQLENLESALLKQHERLKQIESRSGLDDQRYELLTSAIDQKTQVAMPDLTALMERIEAVEASGTEKAKAPDALKEELLVLGESVKQAVDSLDALKVRLDTLEKTSQKPAVGVVDEAVEAKSEVTEASKRPKKKEASLLKRAIEEKQDAASTAVSRIIDPESKSTTTDGKAESEKPKSEVDSQEISSEIEALPDDFSVSLGADLMADDDLFGAEEIAEPKKSTAKKAAKKKAASVKPALTTVEVNKLMGIGNKPFLRGSGAGLSWDKGVEMDFQEIGKWNWSAKVSADETVELQVYSNDEDADRKGKHTLEPGQRLEITPEF